MTGYTFKSVGWPTDNGLVNEIAEKQRAERAKAADERRRQAEESKRVRRYRTRWGMMALDNPLDSLPRRKKGKSKRSRRSRTR